MDVVSQSTLRVAKFVWRPGHGGFAFTVVCKATFALRPDVSQLAPAQEPVVEADVYTADGGSLVLASELCPFKKRPELLLTGHAYAPEGKRVPSFVSRIAAGEIDKSIQVAGDRMFGLDGRLTDPALFVRMPLVWERAAGGPDTFNPAGRPLGSAARPDAHGGVPAPNLLPLGLLLSSRSDVVPPVGFGPIAPFWPSRAACLHRVGAGWDPARWQERPLPPDIELAYFNAAPPDQQRAQPFGEEHLYLENLHPLFSRLSTRLAPVPPAATVDRGHGPEPLQLRCDTLLLDTNRGLAMLVWRAHVLLDHPDQPGRVVVTNQAAPQAQQQAELPAQAKGALIFDHTQDASFVEQAQSTLPFSEVSGAAASSSAVAPEPAAATSEPAASALLSGMTVPVDALFGGTMAFGFAKATPVLPFPPSQEDSAPQREAPPAESSPALPFGLAPAPLPPPPMEAEAHARDVSPWVAPGAWLAMRAAKELALAKEVALPTSPVDEPPVPPPLVGAVALGAADLEDTGEPGQPPAMAAGTAGETSSGAQEMEVDFMAYPPERCGAIAARVACDGSVAADILRGEDLDAARWERVHEHWLDRIDSEVACSRTKMRADYDSAYVRALETQRGPIAIDVYAQLAEAAERGATEEALAERGLPEDAWPHIHRVWIQRMVKDVKVGKQVRTAIVAARTAG